MALSGRGRIGGLRTGRKLAAWFLSVMAIINAPSTSPPAPIIVAVGDMACAPGAPGMENPGSTSICHHGSVSDLVGEMTPVALLALGDEQYHAGTLEEFRGSYAPTFGRYDHLVRPVPGNHEYITPGAAGYYAYFGERAGDPAKGYYSYDVGDWHIVALNSGLCCSFSEQIEWMKADLAAHPTQCTLAYWHHPRWNSGYSNPADETFQPLWEAAVQGGVDVVLNGHAHNYERFAPQDASGQASDTGPRQFIVGTGGAGRTQLEARATNSEVFNNDTYGVLVLKLKPAGYAWSFVPEREPRYNGMFKDGGADDCH